MSEQQPAGGFKAFFWLQALGAYNDNIYKQAVIILITYQSVRLGVDDPSIMVNLAAGLFILPFMLFAAMAGQIADRMDKTLLIRRVKAAEVALMLAATVALFSDSIVLLLAVLMALGLQSTFFAPVKYGVIPQLVGREQLMRANGLVNAATNVAILLGSILGGVLIAIEGYGPGSVALIGLVAALIGYALARRLPSTEAQAPGSLVNWNPLISLCNTLSQLIRRRELFLVALGISWFWFFGSVWFAQLPNFTREVLSGDERVAAMMFAVLIVGIGTGSVLCNHLARVSQGPGLVPFGALGLTLFGVLIWWLSGMLSPVDPMGLLAFVGRAGSWWVIIALLMLGVSAGFYIVPLYSLVQIRARSDHRARVFGAVNILNALFMVMAALAAMALFNAGWSIREVLLATALTSAVVTVVILLLDGEFARSARVLLSTR